MNVKTMLVRNFPGRTCILAAAVALVFGAAASAQVPDKGCSAASLYGTFSYTSVGSLVAPPSVAGPYAEVGAQVFDGHGGITGSATISQNGNIIPVTITGTYVVNSNCTGTFSVAINPLGFTAHYSFVIDQNETEFQALCTDTGAVITRVARRQFAVEDWRR
jgi:hypothetical protein